MYVFSEPDGGYKDSPTQNFDKDNSTRGIESFKVIFFFFLSFFFFGHSL